MPTRQKIIIILIVLSLPVILHADTSLENLPQTIKRITDSLPKEVEIESITPNSSTGSIRLKIKYSISGGIKINELGRNFENIETISDVTVVEIKRSIEEKGKMCSVFDFELANNESKETVISKPGEPIRIHTETVHYRDRPIEQNRFSFSGGFIRSYWIAWILWVTAYVMIIIICSIGKKKNPNNGWNLIISGEILFMLAHIPAVYFRFYCKNPSMVINYYYFYWISTLIGMGLSLRGLHRIAINKNS